MGMGLAVMDQAQPMLGTAPGTGTTPYDQSTWGQRPDGTEKGAGFLGAVARPDGTVSTELSVGVQIGGQETEIPTMVPGLTEDELKWLLTTPADQQAQNMPRSILEKAVAHAKARIAAGLSPFKQEGEE